MNYRLVSIRSRGKDIIIYGRDKDGYKKQFIDSSFSPYFYVPSNEDIDCKEITNFEEGFVSIYGDILTKIYVNDPQKVPLVRAKFTNHFEGDIPYCKRYLIDRQIKSYFDENLKPVVNDNNEISLLKGYLDIEVYSSKGHGVMPNPQNKEDKITAITITNEEEESVSFILDDNIELFEHNGKQVFHCLTEEDLLNKFLMFLEDIDFDILCGWNVDFDIGYIKERCKRYDFNPFLFLGKLNIFDLLFGYKFLFRKRSYRLKDVVFEEGITQELGRKVNYNELWEENKEELIKINRNHSKWLSILDKKHMITDFYLRYKDFAGLDRLEDSLFASFIIDTLILRRSKNILPSRQAKEVEKFEGALILKPEVKLADNVAVFDLSRFYPTIILEELLDPVILFRYKKEKKIEGNVEDWNKYKEFAKSNLDGTVILNVVKELIEERVKLENSKEHLEKIMAIKGILNATYGVLAYSGFRLNEIEIPKRITARAREIISDLRAKVKEYGFTPIYLDTDAIFIMLNSDKNNDIEEAEKTLNQVLQSYGNYLIKLDHFFKRIIFTGVKKKYAGIDRDGKIHIVGFERVRSDSSSLTQKIQQEVLSFILNREEDKVIPYLQKLVDNIQEKDISDICITKTLSKNLEEYTKQEQDYIKCCKFMKEKHNVDFTRGDAVNIVYSLNYPYNVAVYKDKEDLPFPIEVDWDKVIEKEIVAKVEDILEASGLSVSEIKLQGKQSRLF